MYGVAEVFSSRLPSLQSCYEAALKRRPPFSGQVVLHVNVQPDGTVSRFSAASDFSPDVAMEICMATKVCEWRFPRNPRPETVTVEQMLNLTPVQAR